MVAKSKVGRPPAPPSPRDILKDVLPVADIFEEDELILYNKLIDVYINDFDIDDLTASDMDDILDLAKNRVLETRLLKLTKGNIEATQDVSGTIEKLTKKNDKIKESLSSRRKDRLNPNEFKGFSIVDLVVGYHQDKKKQNEERLSLLAEEEKSLLDKRKNYKGNRDDIDIEDNDN